jgi:hypothetical protein
MPIQATKYQFLNVGSVFLGDRSGGPIENVGEAPELALEIAIDAKVMRDTSASGGGNLEKYERVESMSGSIKMHKLSPSNLGIALRANQTEVASGAVTGELHDGYLGALVPFVNLYDPDVAPVISRAVSDAWAATTAYDVGDAILDTSRIYVCTVAGTSGGTEPTWPTDGTTVTDGTVTWKDTGTAALVANTDYTLIGAGALISSTSTKFLAGYPMPLTIGYTKNASYLLEMLTNSGTEYRLIFGGLNEGDNDAPNVTELYRVKFSPTAGLPLKGDDWMSLDLTFEVLSDPTKTGAGLSKFGRFKLPKLV